MGPRLGGRGRGGGSNEIIYSSPSIRKKVESENLVVNFLETSSKINILYVTFTLNTKQYLPTSFKQLEFKPCMEIRSLVVC